MSDSTRETLQAAQSLARKMVKDAHVTNLRTMEAIGNFERDELKEEMVQMWMALNASITKELLDLRLRVQNTEDKLGIKQKTRISKG